MPMDHPHHLSHWEEVVDIEQVQVPVVSAVGLTVHAHQVLEGSFFQVGKNPSVHEQQHSVQRCQPETHGRNSWCE